MLLTAFYVTHTSCYSQPSMALMLLTALYGPYATHIPLCPSTLLLLTSLYVPQPYCYSQPSMALMLLTAFYFTHAAQCPVKCSRVHWKEVQCGEIL